MEKIVGEKKEKQQTFFWGLSGEDINPSITAVWLRSTATVNRTSKNTAHKLENKLFRFVLKNYLLKNVSFTSKDDFIKMNLLLNDLLLHLFYFVFFFRASSLFSISIKDIINCPRANTQRQFQFRFSSVMFLM